MTTSIVADPLVRLARAAAELNVSTWTLRNWCISGRVQHHRLGPGRLILIPISEIKRLLRESSVQTKSESAA